VERKNLTNPPLVETIFELRWELQSEQQPGIRIDPHYKILIGEMFGKVKNDYSFHEQLPAATIPDEIVGHVVQHRFREAESKWPLIQLGPGIITLNDTEGYEWVDFQRRLSKMLDALWKAYPNLENFRVNTLLLRYIDAIDFDYENGNVFHFMKKYMRTDIKLQEELFKVTGVDELPFGFDLRFSFCSVEPKGILRLRFARGKKGDLDALIWETGFQLTEVNVPNTQEEILKWVNEAHDLVHNWFFKVIEGKLERMFE